FPIQLAAGSPLFVDQTRRNYYPAPLSEAIDSSIDTITDRTGFITIRDPLGIGVSPIKTPTVDAYGQTRGDDPDVTTPAAQGANVFKDRGAIDRVDFFRPTAYFSTPLDQAASDLDSDLNDVWLNLPGTVRELIISLSDVGIGIDDGFVLLDGSQFKLYMDDGVKQATDLPDLPSGTVVTEGLLTQGVDYVFVYNSVTNEVIFRSTTAFPFERKYRITIDNNGTSPTDTVNGVRDLAGNYLAPNRTDGTTQFTLLLTDGVNDPPVNTIPLGQTTPEDTSLTFSVAGGNAISVSDADVWLGNNTLRVRLEATNSALTLSRTTGLTFSAGDGTNDATMEFTGLVDDINRALDGMTFRPDDDYFGTATVTITTNDLGGFTGPPTPPPAPQQDVDVLSIVVTPVNDAPKFSIPSLTQANENEGNAGRTVVGFATGINAGAANETPPQTVSVQSIVVSQILSGPWTTSNFLATNGLGQPDISLNLVTGDLFFRTSTDVNGSATISITLVDSDGAQRTKSFTLTIDPINDAPVYTTNIVTDAPGDNGIGNLAIDAAGTITIDEDGGRQLTTAVTVDFVNQFAPAAATALDEIGLPQTTTWSVSSPVILPGGNLVFTRFEVDNAGNITFQTAQDTAGSATFTLTLQDNGGTANGGVDLLARTFTIVVRQLNDAPVAISADNYFVDEGYDLTLDASASYDPDTFFGDALTFDWDLNNDGIFETAAGGLTLRTVTWAYLAGLGISAPGLYPIRLRATDLSAVTNVDTATVTTLIVDYGDAPDTYKTFKSSGGAAHTINGTLYLGSTIDKEQTGQPNATATGDGADEDGVIFLTSFESDPTRILPAYVDVISSAAGKVDMWLDLNLNGEFDHATEHLNNGVSFSVNPGTNRLFFTIPSGTPVGNSMLRVRLSSAGLLQPSGRANDGEVEDYAVEIVSLQAPTTPTFTRPFDFNLADGRMPQTSDLTPEVAWTPRLENYSYDLEVRNASNVVIFTQTDTTLTSFDMPTLAAGIYTATLTAYNKVDVAAAPAVYQFEVVPVVVATPSGDVQTYRPTISWNHVEGTKTYSIELESLTTGQQFFFTVDATTASPPNQLVLTNDLAIGQYRVRVRATDAVDNPGNWSAFSNFNVRTPVTITAPTGSVTNVRPQITWNAVPGAVRYSVTLFNVTDNVTTASVSNVLTNNWTPTSNLPLATYRITVVAFNSAGDTTLPNPEYLFNVSPVPVVVSPSGSIPDSTPTFSWNAVAGADRYELIVSRGYGDFGVVFTESNLTGTQYTRTAALPLARYTYRIRAINEPGNGSTGSAVISSFSATTAFTVTERPTVTSPAATTFLERPVITWTAPIGSSSAMVNSQVWVNKIEKNSQGQPYNVTILNQANIPGNSFTVNQDLILGTYVVWVRTYSTVDPAAVSEWSIAKTFRVTTKPTAIGPTGRTADATPTLTWAGVPGGQTYRVYVSSVSNNVVAYDVSGLNALNYTIPSNLPIGRYRFWVQATSAFGDVSAWSDGKDFQVVTSPTLSGPSSSTFNTRPSFTWTNMAATLNGVPAGAQFYDFRIDRVLRISVQTNYILAEGLTSTGYNVSTDLPSGIYRAYARARRSDTQGDYTVALEFFVGGRPVVNVLGTTTNTTPTFTWKTVDGASGYEIFIQLATALPGAPPLIRQTNIGSTSYTVQTALAKGAYRVWVRAINAATGAFSLWSEGASTNFTIADASDSTSVPTVSEFVLTTMPLSLLESSTESAISMLPAVISGSEYQAVVSDVFQPAEMKPVVQPVPSAEPVGIMETELADQADEILSSWDQQLWWDASENEQSAVIAAEPAAAIRSVTDGTSKTRSGTVGFFGALLALAPKSLRRRRAKEERSEN
ncbi:MAG: GEVED domain-containing protein, partial [Planctomycetota bacterium]